ncbi:DUF723 domain-containing protein [Neomicrococcus aestuarii]
MSGLLFSHRLLTFYGSHTGVSAACPLHGNVHWLVLRAVTLSDTSVVDQ